MRKIIFFLIVCISILVIFNGTVKATPIGDKSWTIWWQDNVFKNPTNYIPNPADYSDAKLINTLSDRTHLVWYPGAGFWENSIFIARTWLFTETPQTIPVRIAGDDGHSLYVNDSFIIGQNHSDIGSPPFESVGTIFLNSGWNKVEATLYNGPINAGLIVQDNGYPLLSSIVNDMNSSAIPEPATTLLLLSIALLLIGLKTKKGSQSIL